MVYESDFYTSRRPYRPATSSYSSVTPVSTIYYLPYAPSFLPYPYDYGYSIPSVSYIPKLSQAELIYRPTRTVTRLATYPEAPHHVVRVRVRPSVVMRELDRISNRPRAHVGYSAVDEFYRSEATRQFEDETRRIRADTASLMQRARSVVPRAKSVVPLDTIYSYGYGEPLPYRFSNDTYVTKLVLPLTVRDHIKHMSFWNEPAKKFSGRGHLACVHYSGNKAFPNRRPLYKELSIRDDVNLLSFYAKNRLAAAGLATEKVTVKLLPWRPSRKFQAPLMMEDPALELKAQKADREARFRATTAEPTLTPTVDLAEIKRKRQEEMRAAEEKALKEEAKKEAERKAQAEREAAEKKKAEEEARKAEEAKRQAEEEARKADQEAARKAAEEEANRKAKEEAKKAEEARLAEEAKKAEEEAKRKAEEEAKKAEEEARLAEEAKLAEEEQRRQEELARLAELEKQAQEEREDELARQAAELAEIARQESELAAQRLEEISQSAESAEPTFEDAEPTAEAEDSETPAETEAAPETTEAEAEPEPIVEEPVTPEVAAESAPADEPAGDVSEDDHAEQEVTDEE